MKKTILTAITAAFIVGCATSTTPERATSTTPERSEPLPTERTFNAPKSCVWPLTVAEVGLNYPIKSSDVENGLLVTDAVSLPVGNWNINKAIRRWVLSPGGNVLTGYSGLRVAMNVLVTEPEANKTHVVVRTRYEARQGPLGSPHGTWVGARSNGSLEQEILNHIADRLAKPQQ